MFAINTIIKRYDGNIEIYNGSLFKLPAELVDNFRIQKYLELRDAGWSVSEFGYSAYIKTMKNGDAYIFPGLIIKNERKPRKKFGNYNISFTKESIELFANDIVMYDNSIREKVEADVNLLVHDLRRLSTAIYHAAEEALNFLGTSQIEAARVRIRNVIASQTMLKIRADALDLEGNPDSIEDSTIVPVHRRVDKVVRCFSPLATRSNVNLRLSGSSFQSAKGPDLFKIIPYILIDNAIKYSPKYNNVDILVQDQAKSTVLSVKSVGPKIEEIEKEKLYDKRFRGIHATRTGKPGSGIGLHLAKMLVQAFHGSLELHTSGIHGGDGDVPMSEIEFRVVVPTQDW